MFHSSPRHWPPSQLIFILAVWKVSRPASKLTRRQSRTVEVRKPVDEWQWHIPSAGIYLTTPGQPRQFLPLVLSLLMEVVPRPQSGSHSCSFAWELGIKLQLQTMWVGSCSNNRSVWWDKKVDELQLSVTHFLDSIPLYLHHLGLPSSFHRYLGTPNIVVFHTAPALGGHRV